MVVVYIVNDDGVHSPRNVDFSNILPSFPQEGILAATTNLNDPHYSVG